MVFKRICAFTAAFVLCCAALTVSAKEATGKTVYKNDFSASVLTDDIEVLRGETELQTEKGNNFLHISPDEKGYASLMFGPQSKNFDIDFKCRITLVVNDTWSYASMCFRSPCLPTDASMSYRLNLTTWQTAVIVADLFADNNQTLLPITSDAEFTNTPGLWYNFRVCTRDDTITVYANGDKVFEVQDEMYNIKGGFGFYSSGTDFDVDDIVITEYTGGTLPATTPNEVPQWKGSAEDQEHEVIMDDGLEPFIVDLGGGGEQVGGTQTADPNEMTVNSFIAIGLIAALVISAVSTVTVTVLLLKVKGKMGGK